MNLENIHYILEMELNNLKHYLKIGDKDLALKSYKKLNELTTARVHFKTLMMEQLINELRDIQKVQAEAMALVKDL